MGKEMSRVDWVKLAQSRTTSAEEWLLDALNRDCEDTYITQAMWELEAAAQHLKDARLCR